MRTWSCPSCQENFDNPGALGRHYIELPEHRKSKRPRPVPRQRLSTLAVRQIHPVPSPANGDHSEPAPTRAHSVTLIDLGDFPGPSNPRPGVEYIYVPAQEIPLYKERGFKLTSESHEQQGVIFLLMVKGEPLFGITPEQVEPSIKVYLGEGLEALP